MPVWPSAKICRFGLVLRCSANLCRCGSGSVLVSLEMCMLCTLSCDFAISTCLLFPYRVTDAFCLYWYVLATVQTCFVYRVPSCLCTDVFCLYGAFSSCFRTDVFCLLYSTFLLLHRRVLFIGYIRVSVQTCFVYMVLSCSRTDLFCLYGTFLFPHRRVLPDRRVSVRSQGRQQREPGVFLHPDRLQPLPLHPGCLHGGRRTQRRRQQRQRLPAATATTTTTGGSAAHHHHDSNELTDSVWPEQFLPVWSRSA